MKLLMPIEKGIITARFFDKSALDGSHIHGAVDIAASVNTEIVAPEDGKVFGWFAVRQKEGTYWPRLPQAAGYKEFSFANYFYDMYGACLFLESEDKARTHIFCHIYGNQLFNFMFPAVEVTFVEEKEDKRFPIFGIYTLKNAVEKGELIGYTGHAGSNLGAHLHWEIHSGLNNWKRYEDRINPEELI